MTKSSKYLSTFVSEFWEWVSKNASYVPEESHKFLSELIARPADTTLLAKTSSIQVKSRRRESQSNVLSSKLNSIKIKEKPENDHKINESQVEERLSKGTYSNYPFYDRLTVENGSKKSFN